MTAADRPDERRQRIDKWLYFARIVKSRSLAQAYVTAGHVRINGSQVRQPSRNIVPGDRLDISLERGDLVLVVKGAGERRGPYEEAKLLYEDHSLPAEQRLRLTQFEQATREPGSGRPTKRERRETDALRRGVADDGN